MYKPPAIAHDFMEPTEYTPFQVGAVQGLDVAQLCRFRILALRLRLEERKTRRTEENPLPGLSGGCARRPLLSGYALML